ncbi:phage tail protein [Paenibacillus apiarius]|uniref:phage tail protein n=1 Tax=Paenibacillus apiarius TaxID=46240 RepID=UPI003B3B6FC8
MSDEVGKVSLGLELDEKPLGKQISNVAGSLASTMKESLGNVFRGLKGAGKATVVPAPEVDTGAIKSQINDLSSVLDNVNAKIEVQQRKLAELNESYENAFSDKRKGKLQEKIINTEGTLLRLTQTSDKTAQKLWELEDRLKGAGGAAAQADKPVEKLGSKLIQANKPLKPLGSNLDKAAKAAAGAGTAFETTGRSAGKMGNQFTAAFSRILKQVFVFTVLYKAIRGFNEYLGASLKTNAQFAASLNAIKTNLAVAFQPIYDAILPAINALMSAVAKITAYIAAFISALFGKTYKQSYDAAKGIETAKKAMEGYGKKSKKAGKDAKGALASFDELNTLDMSKADADADADSGAGGGFEMTMPDMDIGGIQAQMDSLVAGIRSSFDSTWQAIRSGWDWTVKTFGPSFATAWGQISPVLGQWKESFRALFADIMTLGQPLANWVLTGLVPMWQKGIVVAGNVVAGLLDSMLNVFNSIRTAVFPILEWFVTNGLPIITEFMTGALDVFGSLFDGVKRIFDDLWSGVVGPTMQLISKIIIDALNVIKSFWDDWGKKIVDGIKVALDGIKKLWSSLWDSFLKPFVTNMLNMLTQLWDKHLKGLIKEVTTFVGKLATAALDILNKFILPIVNWLVQKLGPTFSNIFSFVVDVIGTAVGAISDVLKGLIKALGGVVDFIAGVFTLDWKRAWNGIKDFTGGIFDAIVGVFKGAVNLIIDAFNFMIRQVSKVSFDVPDWVPGIGGETVGFKIPEIPKLAKGGLAYGPTLAMVGDNRGASVDPEVVSPLSKLQEMLGANNQPVVDALMALADILRRIETKESGITIGETEFGRIAARAIGSAERQAGRPLFAR